ncbi:hypothetical protein SAMN04487859_10567 [Roseovarius lutimaris]|uniref:Uncharacterized protein n=1 Tax=Roseovarius lutimaris TaxID=1005928 RepID=A0A1I5A5F6_9RHOB|nr:hypothetical protein SAMN04487859_10567 [Roseovarius lutimaris]
MQTQDVERRSSRGGRNEALASHERVFATGAYSFSRNSAMMRAGYTRVTLTSPFGRSGGCVPVASVYADKRDRRNTCRTASRAFSQLALWPLSQLAHSPHRKNSSLSSPSRFRPSRLSPVSTSNLFKVEQGQAAPPVPLLARCVKARDLRYRVAASCGYHHIFRSFQPFSGPCALLSAVMRAASGMSAPVSVGSGGVS